jgi:hypothetical protein
MVILQMSASQVAKIPAMSLQCPALLCLFLR